MIKGSLIWSTVPWRPQAYRFKWGDYAALSYCWGEPANLKAIVVNNRVIHVTQNLEAALQALRKMAKFQKQYRLWVDAICINQQDLQEKSHQVRLVGEIYRRSWNVVVWIGPEEDFSNEGVDFFRVLAAYWPDHREIEDALQKDPKLFGVGGAHGMEILCLRPYWKRVWIIQELMSGNTETPVLCGSKIIEWDKMWKGLEVFTSMDKMAALVDADRRNIGIRNEGNAFGGIYCVIRLSKLMEMLFRSIDSPLIPVLIDCSRSSEATDNRDMTYGMLDLMEKRLASFIVPDYTKSASQVYASFVSAYIAAYDHVDVIRHGGLPKSAMHPTWAPDCKLFASFPVNVGNITRARIEGVKLICSSIIFDAIDGILNMVYPNDANDSSFLDSSTKQHAYKSDEEALDAFRRNLHGDRNNKDELLSAEESLVKPLPSGLERYAFAEEWNRMLELISDWKMCGRSFGAYMAVAYPSTPALPQKRSAASKAAFDRISDVLGQYHSLITTRRGYFGLAPKWIPAKEARGVSIRQGDIICVVFGCTMPLVIRRYRDGYQLVGECYVQGMMNSEAQNFIVDGEAKVEELIFY
ncbi:HET-domain-containing protein [Stipitochalara longipes BDJ]|nr:HET-domain-containing protein [Stipitochalara longipes BDJ]